MNYLDLGEYKVKTDNHTQQQLPASFPKTITLKFLHQISRSNPTPELQIIAIIWTLPV